MNTTNLVHTDLWPAAVSLFGSPFPASLSWQTLSGAPLPAAVAYFIAVVVAVAFVCQWSLRGRYRRADTLVKHTYESLAGEVSFGQVRAAARATVGDQPGGAGALVFAFVEQAERRGTGFQAAAVVESVRERETQLRRAAFVRWVSGTALVMGLAGTFLAFTQLITGSGLTEALGTLQNTPASTAVTPELANSYSQLGGAFTRVYEGFRLAFVASLVGLAGTMFLSLVNIWVVGRARGNFLARLEDFGAEVLQPLLSAAGKQTADLAMALTNAASALGASGQSLDALRETSIVLDRASRQFEQSQGASSEMVATLNKLAGEIDASQGRWDVLLDALRDSRASMSRSVDDFRKEAAAQRDLSDATTTAAVAGMRQVVADLAAEVRQVNAAKAEHFAAVQGDVRRMLVESKQEWDKASAALLAKTDEAFKASLETIQGVIADSRQDAARTREEIAGVARQTAAVVADHQQALAEHSQAVTASLQTWADAPAALTAAVHSGGEALDKLRTTLDSVEAMPERWETRVLGSVKRLDTRLVETTARLERGSTVERWWTDLSRWVTRRRGSS